MLDDREKKMLGIEDVPVADRTCDDDLVYLRPSACRVMERGSDRLVVCEDKDDEGLTRWIDWALLSWVSGPSTPGDGPEQYSVTMHGSGAGGILRESRHTYFGDKGYVFYVSPKTIAWAFDCLREWFDYDGDE